MYKQAEEESMSTARIYKPCKTAMQSGKAKTKDWLLEYTTTDSTIDDIIGWTGSSDMYASEVKLHFKSKSEAIAYANKNGIKYDLMEEQPTLKPKLRPYTSIYKK